MCFLLQLYKFGNMNKNYVYRYIIVNVTIFNFSGELRANEKSC